MRRADRLFQLVQLLRGGRLVTARQLAERLEVSERTIYRDIADLQASGAPIDGEAGVGYVLRKGFEIPPLMFTREEIEAVVLGARMVEAWGSDTLMKAARQALIKIEAVLPDDLKARVGESHLYSPGFRMPAEVRRRLDQLNEAVRARNIVTIDYRREDGEPSRRSLWPLALFFWGGVWTLVSWCELRADFRSFRLDRVDGLAVDERQYPDDPEKSLGTFLAKIGRGVR